MVTKGDSDYRHALETLMDRGKYNDLDMLRASTHAHKQHSVSKVWRKRSVDTSNPQQGRTYGNSTATGIFRLMGETWRDDGTH